MLSSIAILAFVVITAASAHVMLRAGMAQVGAVGAEELGKPIALLSSMSTNPLVVVAVLTYALSFAAWTVALSRLNLSVAYPALAFMYVLIPLLSWAFLDESVSAPQWAGVLVIFAGVLMVLLPGLN